MLGIVHGDVLSARADALILTIDGARRGLEGNIARVFSRRWPDTWIDIEDQIRYPVPLGRSVATHSESECAFPLVLIASTLHHIEQISDAEKQTVIRSALREAIALAQRHRTRLVATAVMTGGWRLGLDAALQAMFDVLRPIASPDSATTVALHLVGRKDFELAIEVARRCNIDVMADIAANSCGAGDSA